MAVWGRSTLLSNCRPLDARRAPLHCSSASVEALPCMLAPSCKLFFVRTCLCPQTGAALQTFRPPDPSRVAAPVDGQAQQAQQAARQAQQGSSTSGSGESSAAAQGGSGPATQWRQQGGRPGLVSPTGARHQSCLCLCADTMPVAAGFADGRLVFWRWRRRGAAGEGAAAVAHGPAPPAAAHAEM